MALSQVGLERLNTATTKKIGTNKNIIINGAMLVAQRSTDITTGNAGVHCVDRIDGESTNADEAPRRQQVDVSSTSTPYTLGFRKAFKLTNGNQTSGAGVDDIMNIRYNIESQDISQSGWNYKSASSFVTLQFWIKSSVSQNFNMYLRTRDGTNQTYAFDTGTLSADTWTKITKTIPGNSNIQLDNDNGQGLQLNFGPFWGTNRTDNSVNNEEWKTYASASRMKDNATTWYTTDNATFEITGVQLELGSNASPFQFETAAETLQKCQRYCQVIKMQNGDYSGFIGIAQGAADASIMRTFPVPFRDEPTYTGSATSMRMQAGDVSNTVNFNALSIYRVPTQRPVATIGLRDSNIGSMTAGQVLLLMAMANNGKMTFDSEI